MALNPVLVIKVMDGNSVGVRARLKDDYVEHEIVLNSVLAYYWANDFPPVVKFLELFKADAKLEDASEIEINLIEVEADGIGFKIDGKQLILQGFRNTDNSELTDFKFNESFDKKIETPDIVLKKYEEMKNK